MANPCSFRIVILDVETAQSSVDEKFYPEPAMGNMTKDTPAYKAKYDEKREAFKREAHKHPLFGRLYTAKASVGYWAREVGKPPLVNITLKVVPHSAGHFDGFATSVQMALGEMNRPDDPVVILGVHPTTQLRAIRNHCIRTGEILKDPHGTHWIRECRTFNPWHLVCPPSEGEYPLAWEVLGQKLNGPIEDTIALLNRLGPEVLASKE